VNASRWVAGARQPVCNDRRNVLPAVSVVAVVLSAVSSSVLAFCALDAYIKKPSIDKSVAILHAELLLTDI
jgi:hypothetical protein